MYECTPRAFTASSSSGLDEDVRGSFLGIAEKVQHIKDAGYNAVELLPVDGVVARPPQTFAQAQPDELGLRAVRDADGVAAPEGKSIKFLSCVQLEADGPLRLLLP